LARAYVVPSGNSRAEYIRRSFPEENVRLEELISEIKARDPEPRSVVLQFARWKADRQV